MSATLESRTLSVRIERPYDEVYDFVSQPANFAKWAAGLGNGLREDGDSWLAESPVGPIRIRFSPRNAYGVLDHRNTLPNGEQVYIPMRAIANRDGAEILFTLFREDDWSDERVEADAALVQRDLQTLKALLEG